MVIAIACGLICLSIATVLGFLAAVVEFGWEAPTRQYTVIAVDLSGPGSVILILLLWMEFGIAGAVTFAQKKLQGRWIMVALFAIFTGLIGFVLGLAVLVAGGPITWFLADKSAGRRPCPSCFQYMDERAIKCAHCQTDLPAIDQTKPAYTW